MELTCGNSPLSGILCGKHARPETSETTVRAGFYARLQPVNPLLLSDALEILKDFTSQPPLPGVRLVSSTDITVVLLPELSLEMAAI